ncbi:MAG: hypothetical protein ACP5XB_11660, partial [Isosphaeraceae bacterium]
DDAVRSWNGDVTLNQGEVVGLEGWRFRAGDELTGPHSWRATSHLIRRGQAALRRIPARIRNSGPGTFGAAVTANGVVVSLKAPADAVLTVATDQGKFNVRLTDLADGSTHRYLNGRVEAQRVPSSIPLIDAPTEDDFPAAAADGQGNVWVAYIAHTHRGSEVSESFTVAPKSFRQFVPSGGGDQVLLVRFAQGKAGEPLAITGEGLEIVRPAVAVDGKRKVIVAWSENRGENFDIMTRVYDPATRSLSEPRSLASLPGTDTDVVLATAPDGRVWAAWQGWRDGHADIWLAAVDNPEQVVNVSESAANEWSPALAIGCDGSLHVAYDTYQAGNYDVLLRSRRPDGGWGKPVAIANSPKFEVRPSVAVDKAGRVWVAYEERTANWGKDAQNLIEGKGSSLYRASAVRVRCVEGDTVREAPDPVAGAKGALQRKNGFPRIACDRSGRLWLLFRNFQEAIWGNNAVMVVGAIWLEAATSLSGKAWETPLFLPRSDGLLDNRPALVPVPDGPVLAVYNTDARLRHEVEFTPELARRFYSHSGTPAGVAANDIEIAALPVATTQLGQPELHPVPAAGDSPAVHPNESADLKRVRGHEIQVGGTTYHLLRGEFHRHSEMSMDGGYDGALEDMWRYAIDAVGFDWIGNGDHDAGGGKEYPWWLIQKTTELYHNPPAFVPMFTYERSVSYPHGHRNVMFPTKGVRTLPRLMDGQRVSDQDTKMLYRYLHELGGICASHTSGTGMGTDWRDNDPAVEPFVEIFQGHRNSYEHLGAPRVARRPGEAIGGWRPLGMIWNALAMQYRLGYQASSDHISTHMSYAFAIAEQPTRAAIFDAFKRRHCYAATDNIILDVRAGDHLMGDEFTASGPVRLKVLAHGTGPIKRVDVIKDFVYLYTSEPKSDRVEFEWVDEEHRRPGLSWYYVRVLQEDGQIAWGSPIWVHQPAATAEE